MKTVTMGSRLHVTRRRKYEIHTEFLWGDVNKTTALMSGQEMSGSYSNRPRRGRL